MTVSHRIRLDSSPAFWRLIVFWAGAMACQLVGAEDLPWSVGAATQVGTCLVLADWVWSDSIRQRYPLYPAWGLHFTLMGPVVLLVYLFASRDRWAFLTLALYLLTFALVALGLAWVFA